MNWTVEETQVLLCAWSDERIQKSLAENLRNRHVFKHLSARMSEMGFSRSPHQCRLRVKTLKANYVRAKLQRSMDSAQLCTFKYFEEMDAVLGRRAAEAGGAAYFVSADRMAGCRPNTADTIPTDLYSNAEVSGHRFGSLGRGERQRLSSSDGRRPSLHRDTEVKLEITDDSTDDFEFSDFGFAQQQQQRRDRQHDAYLESSIPPEAAGTYKDFIYERFSPFSVSVSWKCTVSLCPSSQTHLWRTPLLHTSSHLPCSQSLLPRPSPQPQIQDPAPSPPLAAITLSPPAWNLSSNTCPAASSSWWRTPAAC